MDIGGGLVVVTHWSQ